MVRNIKKKKKTTTIITPKIKKKNSCKILNLRFYLLLLWMCSKWLNFRIKKLHFRIKQKIITAINKICKNEQQQHHQKEKRKTWMCSY